MYHRRTVSHRGFASLRDALRRFLEAMHYMARVLKRGLELVCSLRRAMEEEARFKRENMAAWYLGLVGWGQVVRRARAWDLMVAALPLEARVWDRCA